MKFKTVGVFSRQEATKDTWLLLLRTPKSISLTCMRVGQTLERARKTIIGKGVGVWGENKS